MVFFFIFPLVFGPVLGAIVGIIFWLLNSSFWTGFLIGVVISFLRRTLAILADRHDANMELMDGKKVIVETNNYVVDPNKLILKLLDTNTEVKLRPLDLTKKFENKPIIVEDINSTKRVLLFLPADY